ncbi:MAG: HD family phosphohydrolase [Candidatus Krumholzibacteriia bacterium]
MRWWSLRFFKPAAWAGLRPAAPARSGPRAGVTAPWRARTLLPTALAALGLLALHLLLFPPMPRMGNAFPRQGEVAPRQIRAPFAFSAPLPERDVELMRLERGLAEPPLLRRVTPAPGVDPLRRFDAWRDDFLALRARRGAAAPDHVGELDARFPELDRDLQRRLLGAPHPERILTAMEEVLRELLAAGVADVLPPGKYTQVRVREPEGEVGIDAALIHEEARLGERLPWLLRARGLDPATAAAAAGVTSSLLVPNLIYDEVETRVRQERARLAVPARREFIKGERIVEQGVRVSEQEAIFLSRLSELENERGGVDAGGSRLARLGSRLLLLVTALTLYGWMAALYFPPVMGRPRHLLAVAAIVALFLGGAACGLARPGLGIFAVPVALLALLTTVLFKERVGHATTLLGTVMLMPVTGVEAQAVMVWLLTGVVAVGSVRHIQQRGRFYRTIAILCAFALFLMMALRLAAGTPLAAQGAQYLVALLTPVAAVALALFLLPVVEPVIGVASDLTLLELSDLNHPLLKQMSLESQGTYHHSQVVSQLAEQAARAIGANALLTRVGALFHDIGKLNKPEYFVENQRGGPNKHDELSPSMSALVVASHVKEGIELARRWRLPQAVIDFIPEHHGTGVMEFFYHKALEAGEAETVKVDDFRYPGPKPRSRETAILMLADAVEAAARSLAKATPGRIREVTKQVIEKRLLSGELDEAQLTMADLARVREAFIPLLTGIHHARIPYPARREREPGRPRERGPLE